MNHRTHMVNGRKLEYTPLEVDETLEINPDLPVTPTNLTPTRRQQVRFLWCLYISSLVLFNNIFTKCPPKCPQSVPNAITKYPQSVHNYIRWWMIILNSLILRTEGIQKEPQQLINPADIPRKIFRQQC